MSTRSAAGRIRPRPAFLSHNICVHEKIDHLLVSSVKHFTIDSGVQKLNLHILLSLAL